MKEWLMLAFSPEVVKRALITAVVVGTILVAINYGEAILKGLIDRTGLFRIGLTVCVPYLVSTISSMATLPSMKPSPNKDITLQPLDTNIG